MSVHFEKYGPPIQFSFTIDWKESFRIDVGFLC